MMMEEEEKEEEKEQEGNEEENKPSPPPQAGLPSPFRKDPHARCAKNVERGFFVFCPWHVLCSKVEERRNVITDFLWRGSKFRNAYRKRTPLLTSRYFSQ